MIKNNCVWLKRLRGIETQCGIWTIWVEKRVKGWEKHSHRPFPLCINLCNQSPVRLDSRSSWWAGMWTLGAQRADWWRARAGRNVSTPPASGNNRGRGSPWPVLTPLSSHVPCLQPKKRGVMGRWRDRRSVRRKGGGERWAEVGVRWVSLPDSRRHTVETSQWSNVVHM